MIAGVAAFLLSVPVLLGLTTLSRSANPFEQQLEVHRGDYVEFELGPFQSVEYKYLMDEDAPLIFSWLADGELYYDMHAETVGREEREVRSYEQGTASRRMGSMRAPFIGLHGWFWENRGAGTILLRVHSAGFYHTSTVFRDGGSFERLIEPVALP